MLINNTLNSFANLNLEESEQAISSDIAIETHESTVKLGGKDLTYDGLAL